MSGIMEEQRETVEYDRCAVCGAEIEIEKPPYIFKIGHMNNMKFVFITSKGERITMHERCLADLIAFLIELKKKAKAENP